MSSELRGSHKPPTPTQPFAANYAAVHAPLLTNSGATTPGDTATSLTTPDASAPDPIRKLAVLAFKKVLGRAVRHPTNQGVGGLLRCTNKHGHAPQQWGGGGEGGDDNVDDLPLRCAPESEAESAE